ncbi:MAG: family 78 glycoside hydrolase catalytic domain [Clostridia bacterium]|nr:family 78 glycoside hydrolase catalytic domain [Clostridia bacterium]
MFKQAKWINTGLPTGDVVPEYRRRWQLPEGRPVRAATLRVTALGVYEAALNGQRVGEFVLAPGWTSYDTRLQVQEYDVTGLLSDENLLTCRVGKGWYASPMPGWKDSPDKQRRRVRQTALIAELTVSFEDGGAVVIPTDERWNWVESPVRFSEIYDGEVYDASFAAGEPKPCALFDGPMDCLIPQEGEEIREMERVAAKSVFSTPAGDLLVDFGQEVTGWVEFTVDAHAGDEVRILHGEVLDRDGNFYNENYRSAKAELRYTCREGLQIWHPGLTFFGFRYIKLDAFPGEARPEQFTAVAVYSNLRRTGEVHTGHAGINQLISNIFWGQKGNFLDVPTDCPQRDERLGWTGDAQVFVRAASLNYDVERFFAKWLRDMTADRFPSGGVGSVIPNYLPEDKCSAAWGDAATICPWTIYQTYGDPGILRAQFETMAGWVDYITSATTTPNLWTGGTHFADWLGLDAPSGSYKGSSREDFIASAFYFYSTTLVIKAGRVLGEDVSRFEALREAIARAFRETFADYRTQTEHILAIHFGLAEDIQATADALAALIERDGVQMKTGFVGTPYLLHALSDHGHADLAWTLLLREQYPSWLYPISRGATTIWEHWDGIMEDGGFWSADMNSFNHYAYGSVIDWIYEKAAGIRHDEAHPGFSRAIIAPNPDPRLGWLDVSLETRSGRISSKWVFQGDSVRYDIETAVPAQIVIDGRQYDVAPGVYTFWR